MLACSDAILFFFCFLLVEMLFGDKAGIRLLICACLGLGFEVSVFRCSYLLTCLVNFVSEVLPFLFLTFLFIIHASVPFGSCEITMLHFLLPDFIFLFFYLELSLTKKDEARSGYKGGIVFLL